MSQAPPTRRRWFQFSLATMFLAVTALGVAAALVAALCWQLGIGMGYAFPSAANIARMRVTLDGRGSFDVPNDQYADVLAAISPSRLDRYPAKYEVMGGLDMATKDGRSIHVSLYNMGSDTGAFSAGPTFESRAYYRGGTTSELKRVLERAKAQASNVQEPAR